MAKKLLVNGFITQITEKEKVDDEEALFRYEKILPITKKVLHLSLCFEVVYPLYLQSLNGSAIHPRLAQERQE